MSEGRKLLKKYRPNCLNEDVEIRWVVGFEGFYAVTDNGKVFSYHGNNPTKLSQGEGTDGHPFVVLKYKGEQTFKNVHRAMAEAFLDNPENKEQVRHLDDDPKNNVLSNLAWGSHQDNVDDMVKNGNSARGEKSASAKITKEDVILIRKRYKNEDITQKELANEYNLSQKQISDIICGNRWSHVGGPIKGEDYY